MKTFESIGAFVAELAIQAGMIEVYAHNGLERAAQLIEDEAKSEFGVYQGEIGPFNAWQQLADATKADRALQGFSENEPLLRTGKLRDSITHQVSGLEAVVGSDDQVMVYQEMGTDTIPPRPVLGPASLRTRSKVEELLGKAVADGLMYLTPGTVTKL